MKKSIYLTLFVSLFTSLFLLSCSDNEESSVNITESDLIGSWKITSIYTEEGKVSGVVDGVPFSASYSLEGKNYNIDVEFKNNPKEVITQGNITFVASYTMGGESETEEFFGDSPLATGNWSLDGNILTVTGDDKESSSSNIIDFNKTSITFRQSLSNESSFKGDKVATSGYMYVVLSK